MTASMTAEAAGLVAIADEVERLIERARRLVASGANPGLVASGSSPGLAARAVLALCEPAQVTALAWAALAGAVAQEPSRRSRRAGASTAPNDLEWLATH